MLACAPMFDRATGDWSDRNDPNDWGGWGVLLPLLNPEADGDQREAGPRPKPIWTRSEFGVVLLVLVALLLMPFLPSVWAPF